MNDEMKRKLMELARKFGKEEMNEEKMKELINEVAIAKTGRGATDEQASLVYKAATFFQGLSPEEIGPLMKFQETMGQLTEAAVICSVGYNEFSVIQRFCEMMAEQEEVKPENGPGHFEVPRAILQFIKDLGLVLEPMEKGGYN